MMTLDAIEGGGDPYNKFRILSDQAGE
jgi:hypothetical protein